MTREELIADWKDIHEEMRKMSAGTILPYRPSERKIIPFDTSFYSESRKLDYFMTKDIEEDNRSENRRLRNQREREERMMNDIIE